MRVVAFDYAGIQARNVAMESLDQKLVEAFWNNYDIHSAWRERIQKRCPKWMPKNADKGVLGHYRHLTKNKFVFPTFFGAHPFSMAANLGIPADACEDIRDEFFDEFRGIKKWHDGLEEHYYKHGYVTGKSGFICRAPISSNQRINLPIQGDEAIIVLDAASRLAEMQDPRYIPMLEIHDDLTFLWPKDEIERRSEVVIEAMINVPFEWANVVPIEVEASMGEDWLNLKEFGKFSNNKWGGVVEIKK
jgi:DNA polymerase-1